MSTRGKASKEKMILKAVGIGTWEWWLPENKVFFDEIWCRQLGIDPAKVVHEFDTWKSSVHPEDLPGALDSVNQHLEGKVEEFWFIVRMKHRDGHWVHIHSRGRCLERAADGSPRHVVGTHQDVTAEVEKDELSEKIQTIAKLGCWEMDVATQKTQWTKETYKIHGVPYNTSTSKVMGIQFYAEEDRNRISNAVEMLMNEGVPFLGTFKLIDARGEKRDVRISGEPIRSAEGKILKIHGIFQDVTEELKLEREKEELQRQLLEAQQVARIGSWSFDVATGRIFWTDVMFDFFPEYKERGAPSFVNSSNVLKWKS